MVDTSDGSQVLPSYVIPKRVNILLVDDQPSNLVVLEAVLNSPDYNLVSASSGIEALDLVNEMNFGIILLDIQMPDMDGYEVARRIKKLENGKDVPIIFITAIYKEDEHVRKGYEAGAIDYFGKPFDPEVLKAKVNIYANLYLKTHIVQEQEKLLIETNGRLKSELKLKNILDSMPVGVLITDKAGNVTQSNKEANKIWYGREKADPKDLDDLLALNPNENSTLKALTTGKTIRNEEIKVRCYDGSEKTILNSVCPIREINGEITGAIVVAQEIHPPN